MKIQQLGVILSIALPMMLSNITVPLLGLVDTAVIGHLEHSYYLAGVALGSMVVTLVYWLCGFLRMATTGLCAQAYGSGSRERMLQILVNALFCASLISLLLLVLRAPLIDFALSLAGGSAEVQQQARGYIGIRILSAPAALANLALLGWMLGMQSAKAPMWQLIVTNTLNIAFDLLLVVGLDMKVEGAAWASVMADYCGLAMALMLSRKLWLAQWQQLPSFKECRAVFNWLGLRQLLALNRDIFVRSMALQACFAFMTFKGSHLGDHVVAANAVLLNFLLFVSFALDGLAYAVEALAGKAKGEGDEASFRQLVRSCMLLAAYCAGVFSLGFVVAGDQLIALLTDLPEVRSTAQQYLSWLQLLPVLAVWCFVLDGVFIAVAEGRAMRNSMLIASLGVFFPLWWLAQDWGNHALWLAMSGFMLSRGIGLGLLYRQAIARRRWFNQTAPG
ncbi:MATE family efflux transporter DinF [Aliagarivorans taiwanensis]|uniref:MATE family efflux transporter DinF n=1 Tax=Aliagarivorans taiwanensis TaxID=561966 RepID=UPI00040D9DCE|nr:MATE family efflux transporter DinF [Aliagarivorans taiwanensis]